MYFQQNFTENVVEYYCCNGYTRINGDCLPICNPDCINGHCTAPNKCTCKAGYINDENDQYFCKPHCSHKCVSGNCTASETCTCSTGYTRDINNAYRCNPVCSRPCINSECTEPDTCTCKNGYKKDAHNLYQCNAVCNESCVNSDCVTPGVCKCHDGFVKVTNGNNTCIPFCNKTCINGECIAPNNCTCNTGYIKDKIYKNMCYPNCSKCVNSHCVAPQKCQCLAGFTKSSYNPNICKPACSNGCVNAVCLAPENCSCLWGFENVNPTYCILNENRNECIFDSDNVAEKNSDGTCYKVKTYFKLYDINIRKCKFLWTLLKHNSLLHEIKENSQKRYHFSFICKAQARSQSMEETLVLHCTINNFVYQNKTSNSNVATDFTADKHVDKVIVWLNTSQDEVIETSTKHNLVSVTNFLGDITLSKHLNGTNNSTVYKRTYRNLVDTRDLYSRYFQYNVSNNFLKNKITQHNTTYLKIQIKIDWVQSVSEYAITKEFFSNSEIQYNTSVSETESDNEDYCFCGYKQNETLQADTM